MMITERSLIDLANSGATVDPESNEHAMEYAQPVVTPSDHGPMAVVSKDRSVSLELILFADLEIDSDVLHLDDASDITSHIASCEVLPSLFLVDRPMVVETQAILGELGLDIDIIAI